MIKKGLEILKTQNISSINNLEDVLKLPKLYKLFTKLYVLGEDGFHLDRFYLEAKDKYYHTQIMYYEPRGKVENNITFTHFDTIEDVFKNWKNKYGYSEEELDLGLLKIGGIALGGALFVGTKQDDIDNIYLNIWDSEDGLIKLEENVFEFANKLVLEPDEVIPGNVKHSQLYKKWNECFWRIG